MYFSYIENDQADGQREYDKALALSARTTERERLRIQANYADDLGHVDSADSLYRVYLDRYPDDWQALSNYALFCASTIGRKKRSRDTRKCSASRPTTRKTYVEMATAYRSSGKIAGRPVTLTRRRSN